MKSTTGRVVKKRVLSQGIVSRALNHAEVLSECPQAESVGYIFRHLTSYLFMSAQASYIVVHALTIVIYISLFIMLSYYLTSTDIIEICINMSVVTNKL